MPESVVGHTTLVVTDWFSPGTRPAHEGVYERASPAGPFSCWSGDGWNADAPDPAAAARQARASLHPEARWRGLVQPSTEPCATCRGHTVVDRGVDDDSGEDLIAECPDC